jgi:ubiquinone/menaquinone biosynthesis C-methylase UbiE
VTVLDVSAGALARARTRLGARAAEVKWIDADVCADWGIPPVDVWHDRAVFHFLTAEAQRDAYLRQLRRTLKSGGSAILGTFGLDGPTKCSGLPVARYSAETLASTLGFEFTLVDALADNHRTPSGGRQSFTFARFVRR